MNKKLLSALFSLLLFGFSIYLIFNFVKNTSRWHASLSWPKVEGIVLDLNFKEFEQDNYSVNVKYSYTVDGKRYTGNKINIGVMKWMVNYKQKKWFENELRIGNTVPVYYNPFLISDAVLIKGRAGGEIYSLITALMFLIGAICLFIFGVIDVSKSHKSTE